MQKVFCSGQRCPFGKSVVVDTPGCRQCENYFGACGYLFIRCKVSDEVAKKFEPKARKKTGDVYAKKKRGRPKKNK